ncbi:MAG: alpha/beta hydrolase [Patescibacteria group bacterium]
MKKVQVLRVHGGMTFKNDKNYLHYLRTKKISTKKKISWKGDYLEKSLGKKFEVIAPQMPLSDNAKYRDWAILFKRYLALLKGKYILIGSSLGGVFLAKYLSENKLSKKAWSVYLVGAPFDNTVLGEDLVGGFNLKADLSLLEKNCKNLYLLFSEDDDVVPIAHSEKYKKKLKNARILVYKNKHGHFNVSRFPEIIKLIKEDVRKT